MPKPCDDCAAASIAPLHSLYSLACLWCGARLVGRLRELPRPAAEIKARQSKVLEDWQALGHDRAELLRLSRTECPVAPLDSEPPTQEKPRSARQRSSTASSTGSLLTTTK